LTLHPEKTRLIEFGRARNRAIREVSLSALPLGRAVQHLPNERGNALFDRSRTELAITIRTEHGYRQRNDECSFHGHIVLLLCNWRKQAWLLKM